MFEKFSRPLLVLFCIIIFQDLSYHYFFKPSITQWGATQKELTMPLAGDTRSTRITSTRAITINTSQQKVWGSLMQLGADRSGFYSYTFIERALGYITREQANTKPLPLNLKPGDMVRGSIDPSKSIYPYHFPVLKVIPQKTLVLGGWGTFELQSISKNKTRLITRTQELKTTKLIPRIFQSIIIPFHFLMERRTLIGIKELAELGHPSTYTPTNDISWFFFIALSGLCSYILVFIGTNNTQKIYIPCLFSLAWLSVLFVFPPVTLYSAGLLLIELSTILYTHIQARQPAL